MSSTISGPPATDRPLVVAFAHPAESAALRHRLGRQRQPRLGGHPAIVLHTGIGPAAATAAVERLLATSTPRGLIGAGLAGGLDPGLRPGTIVVARNFSSPDVIPPAALTPGSYAVGDLTTVAAPVADPAAKAALRAATGAVAVDMESAVLHRLCAVHRLPLAVIRAIYDAADESLPRAFTAAAMAPPAGTLGGLRFLAALLARPREIPVAIRLLARLPRLAHRLATAIEHAAALFPPGGSR